MSIEARDTSSYQVRAVRIFSPIVIDGRLDEKSWEMAAPAKDFKQREPKDGQGETEKTEVRILYDEDNLYIGFRCFDSEPSRIVANEMRRDGWFWDNDLIVLIMDTYRDRRNGFYIATTPLGAKFDAYVGDEGLLYNTDWDGIWDVKTSIDKEGWVAEFAIPFSTLRFNAADSIWGINFGRKILRKNELVYWRPVSRDLGMGGFLMVSYAGELVGIHALRQNFALQLLPSVLGGWERNEEGSAVNANQTFEASLGLKYSITSNVTLDATLNPDFAQIESDAQVVNLTRFSLFYPEKRPFFIEGSDVFRTPLSLFYTRRIGLTDDRTPIPILGGVKVTGKVGPYSLGVIGVSTKAKSFDNAQGAHSEIPASTYSILRFRSDIFDRSFVGLLAASKDNVGNYDRVFGADFNFIFFRTMQVEGATSVNTSSGANNRWASKLSNSWSNDLLNYSVSIINIEKNFDPKVGLIVRNNIREVVASVGTSPRPSLTFVRQMWFSYAIDYLADQRSELLTRHHTVSWQTFFENSSYLDISFNRQYELLDFDWEISPGVVIAMNSYQFDFLSLYFTSDKSQVLSADLHAESGDFYDGKKRSFGITGQVILSGELKTGLDYRYNSVDLQSGKFETNVLNGKVTYSLSPELSSRTTVQWNKERGFVNFNTLVRYTYLPGSEFYFTINSSRYEALPVNGLGSSSLTIIAKFSYLIGV